MPAISARIHIRHQNTRYRRPASWFAAHRRDARQAHIADIVVSLVDQWSPLAIACDRAINYFRIQPAHGLIINT